MRFVARLGASSLFLSLLVTAGCAVDASQSTGDARTDRASEALSGAHESDDDGHSHSGGDGDEDRCGRGDRGVGHVLLLSIDGMHEVDLAKYIASHPASALASLAHHGVRYTNAWVNRLDGTPSNPSDSFPGTLALVTGGSSKTHGGWYDAAYTRDLYPGTAGCAGASGSEVSYDETIVLDSTSLWSSAIDDTPTHDSKVLRARIVPSRLPFAKQGQRCTAVYPHDYLRVNTIFEVAKQHGLHTAWSDKHVAYEVANGPSGSGIDDFFAPEIKADPSKSLIPSAPPKSLFTDKWTYTEVYDDYKVAAILNQIDGRWSDDGLPGARDTDGHPGTPAIFGMNFQAVSVAQKDSSANGGYVNAAGEPGPELTDALAHTDASIGRMIDALDARGILRSTVIIVTAKHGQSPIDRQLYRAVDGKAVATFVNAAAPVAFHLEDDAGFYWLANSSTAPLAMNALLSAPPSIDPRIDTIYTPASAGFTAMFGDPTRDPRTPDVIFQPVKGTLYSLSTKKNADHGGFDDDDAHVALLVSNPRLHAAVNDEAVRTKQVAPTILRALDLDPRHLEAVRKEGTRALPALPF